MTAPGLSYIVPAYNEEGAIVATIERLRAVLATLDMPHEIIVVDDGSRDQTRARMEPLADGVRLINHPVNVGYGSAIKAGILAARYDWIGIVDADGTYDIESLPRLIEKMHEGFDMAIAARENVLTLDSPAKRLSRRLMVGFLNLIIGARIEDPNSGFRVFTRKLAMTFFPFLCNTFSFTTSLTVFALGERAFVAYVPLTYSARIGKTKVRHFRDSLRMIQLVLQGITFFNPVKLYLMLVVGLVAVFLIPSLILLATGYSGIAAYWFATGAVSCLLVGIGMLGDVVRISTIERGNDPR